MIKFILSIRLTKSNGNEKFITPALKQGIFPKMLEQYSTLTIQVLDLGFVIPTTILASILLIKRKPFRYLLTSVMIVNQIYERINEISK